MFLEDFENNKEIMITKKVVIQKEKMLDFARIYDPIPLHMDEDYAKKTRFGKLIAPGVMTFMSVWAEFTRNNIFGEELIAGKSTKIEWFKPVYEGDELVGKTRISAVTKRNAYNGIVETTMEVFNQKGELVLENITESIVKCRENK